MKAFHVHRLQNLISVNALVYRFKAAPIKITACGMVTGKLVLKVFGKVKDTKYPKKSILKRRAGGLTLPNCKILTVVLIHCDNESCGLYWIEKYLKQASRCSGASRDTQLGRGSRLVCVVPSYELGLRRRTGMCSLWSLATMM